jgi:hypothetical protein
VADNTQNGWNEYSKLVLKELESLGDSIQNLNSQIVDIKKQLTEFKAREDRVDELRVWKQKVDEVVSPTQLKEALVKIEDLNTFKVKAIGVFIAVQFLMSLAVLFTKFI